METIEERVDTLEDILSRFITQTNSALLRLERAIEANRKRSEEERKKDRIEWKEKIAEDDRKWAKKMEEWDRKAGEDDRKRAEDAKERKEKVAEDDQKRAEDAKERKEKVAEDDRKRAEDAKERKEKVAEDDRKWAKKMEEWDKKTAEEDKKAAEDAKERKEKAAEDAKERKEKAAEDAKERKEKIAEDDRKWAKKMEEWDKKTAEGDKKAAEDAKKRKEKAAEDAKERKETEARWARDRMELNKKWGELAVKMGTIVEDIVAPNIPRIAKEYFGCADIDHFAIRVLKRHPTDKSKRREFDVIAVCSDSDKVIFNETKSTIRPEDIRGLIRFLKSGEFFDYFPEYQGKKLIPIFSSLHISSNTVKTLSKNRIYAMVMGDETMTIINFEAVSSKDEEFHMG